MKKWIIRIFFWLIPIILVFIYYHLFTKSSVALSCVFYKTTGWQCPGCGGQRAVHSILEGEFLKGIMYNPLIYFYLFLLVYLYVLIIEGYILRNEKFLFRYGLPDWFGVFFLILLGLFFLLRNIDKIIN